MCSETEYYMIHFSLSILRGHIAVGYLWDVSGSKENVGRFLSLTLQGVPSQTDAVCPRGHSLSPHCVCQKIFLFHMVWFSLWGFGKMIAGVKFLLEPSFGNQAPETAAALNLLIVLSSAAAAAKLLQSCPTLCDPIDGSPPGSPVPGILQARTLEWVAISFSSAWKWKLKVKSFNRAWLLATPWPAAYQAPPSMGFSRQEYWSGVPF